MAEGDPLNDPFESTDPRSLAELLRMADPDWGGWRDDDLAAILVAQLHRPLGAILRRVAGTRGEALATALTAVQPPLHTLEDLLHHPAPPTPLLQFAKEFAKRSPGDTDEAVPRDVAKVIYHAVLRTAQRVGVSITSKAPAEVDAGAASLARLPWVDERTRSVLTAPPRI
jgi:hypothetical protein